MISLGVRLDVDEKKPLGLAPSETGKQSWDCWPTPYGAGARSNGSLLASHFQRRQYIATVPGRVNRYVYPICFCKGKHLKSDIVSFLGVESTPPWEGGCGGRSRTGVLLGMNQTDFYFPTPR